jgi:hypothetical protein
MSRSGLILILIGALLLAHNLGWLTWGWFSTWWPLGLIALGVWSFWDHRNEVRGRSPGGPAAKPEDSA